MFGREPLWAPLKGLYPKQEGEPVTIVGILIVIILILLAIYLFQRVRSGSRY